MTKSQRNIEIFAKIKKMKKLYCVICGKYRKFEKPKMSYFLGKISVFSIICIKWKNEEEKIGVAWYPVSQTSAAQRVVGTKVSWVIMFGKVGELKNWILEPYILPLLFSMLIRFL